MNISGKMLLLVNRLLAQIHLIAAGGPSKEAKAEGAWPKLDQNPEVMCSGGLEN